MAVRRHGLRALMTLCLSAFLSGSAVAETVLHSAPITEDEARDIVRRCLVELPQESVRVDYSRFFVPGSGFQHRVVVKADQASPDELLERLKPLNLKFTVVTDTKGQSAGSRVVSTVAETQRAEENQAPERNDAVQMIDRIEEPPEEEKAVSGAISFFKNRLTPISDDVFTHSIEAHQAVRKLWDKSTAERFVYTRQVNAEKLTVHHDFSRYGEALRLDITVLNNDVKSTTTTIVPDKGEAWLRTDQKVVSSNARHTRTLLERFSSNNILSIPYHYPKDVQTDSEWRELTVVTSEGDKWQLAREKSAGEEPKLGLSFVQFYKSSWLLARVLVVQEDGVLEYEFSDYRELKTGGLIPFVVTVFENNEPIEEIRVDKFDLDAQFPTGHFSKQ